MTDEELAAIVDEYRHDDRSHMGEVLTALAQARRSTKEGDAHRLVVRELAELFGWSDRTPLHALMHVSNAVLNLRSVLAAEKFLRDTAEARLSKCKFCGQDVAEGAGGHTSGCYERKLDRIRAALEIDDCTAMTDAIEEALNE